MQLKALATTASLIISGSAHGGSLGRRVVTDTLSTAPIDTVAPASSSSFPPAATSAVPNPFKLSVTADTSVTLVVISESSLFQLVVYQGFPNVVPPVFLGTGFGTFLMTPQGQTTVTIPPAPQAYQVTAFFEFAQNSSGPFQFGFISAPPTVQTSGNQTVITITSEDCENDDSNEVIAIVDLFQN